MTPEFLLSLAIPILGWICGWIVLGGLRFLGSDSAVSSQLEAQASVGGQASLSVVIPARNEEGAIATLLDSLACARGQAAELEIIVVDDNSSDRTAEIAAARGARVVVAGALPEGWTGKNHALWVGAAAAARERILFLDADCRVEPAFFTQLAATYSDAPKLLTVQPYHRAEGTTERLSAMFNLVVLAAFGSFRIPRQRRTPSGGYGPCMLIDRAAYLRMGGHAAIRDAVLDDVALAQRCAQFGYEVDNLAGRGAISYRMYPGGFRDLVEGWSKHLASGIATPPLPILILLLLWISGMVATAAELAGLHPGALALYLAYAGQLHLLLRQVGSFGLWPALFFPLTVGFFVLVLAYSAVRIWLVGTVEWKGRTIRRSGRST